ncbi:DNA internalization-related competence protein ComEC/Rec2 [bacterium]|nr:DNA internalization-related competence protein ComEC/Rec2 [bacterium]
MIREFAKSALDKKNTLMFITSLSFVFGIMSFFVNAEMQVASVYTLVLCILVVRRVIPFKTILIWIVIFYLGFFNAYFRVKNTDELVPLAPANVELIGRITSIPNSNITNKTKFFFEVKSVNSKPLNAKTYINIVNYDDDFSDFEVGRSYKISGKLRTPFKATNPSQFDYGRYLRNFDVFTILYAEKADCLVIDEDLSAKWRFVGGLNSFRNKIIDVHAKYLKSPNLEILGGIVFGDDAVAPPDYIKNTFVNSGLLHILAASGMNVAFIFGFWFYLLSLLKVPYKPRVISGMGIIVLYTLMTGLGASVIRASLMLLFVLFGKLLDRDSHGIALLSFVAFLMLLYNPSYLNDVGFQLSFVVTFGLLCSVEIVVEKFKGNKFRETVVGAVLVPVVAQIWVVPIQMFYFNTISLYSFFANITVVPFLSVVSFGGFLSSVVAPIPYVGEFICKFVDLVLNFFLNIVVAISQFFSSIPFSLLETFHPTVFQVILYYSIVLLVTLFIKEGCEKRHWCILGALIAVLFVSSVHLPNNKLEVIMFDVGNADAFLIKTPKDKYILVDTGKMPYQKGKSQAEMIIRKYLKDKGVKSLELLTVTHFDSDHAGGAYDIIKNMDVKNVLVNSLADTSKMAQNIYDIADKVNTKITKPVDNEVVYQENKLVLRAFQHDYDIENESSVVLLLSYGDFDVLFTGDAGVVALDRIKGEMPNKVEVLKVGHHGARGAVNKSYVKSLNPEVALVSVGKNNYGHPNIKTLEALSSTDIFRTDEVGTVKIVVDSQKYSVYRFISEDRKFDYVTEKFLK